MIVDRGATRDAFLVWVSMNHRKEIDGLRALAVLPVMFFHAGIETFSGGFTGVDVFFVISGYLITSIIVTEKQNHSFTLASFYERRARRILPALFVVMFACIPLAWLWMLPRDLVDFSLGQTSVATFTSNIFFWRRSGYFDIANDLRPLIHTWSIAVEEQYYLLFPIALLSIWRFGQRFVVGTIGIFALGSFSLAEWGSVYRPTPTFYLLPTRGWELLVGVLVAYFLLFCNRPKSQHIAEVGSIFGLTLIGYAVFALDKNTPFPGAYALFPTIGAALVIVFAVPKTFVGRLLSSSPLVGIGTISYSAYLWHQPILAYARHFSISSLTLMESVALLVLSISLAYFSWRYVESPFRDSNRVKRSKVIWLGVVCTVSIGLTGMVGYLNDGFPDRFGQNLKYFDPPKSEEESVCKFSGVDGNEDIRLCFFGEKHAAYTVALYGDSHARALFSALDSDLKSKGIRGVRAYIVGCLPVSEIVEESTVEKMSVELDRCRRAFRQLMSYFGKNVDAIVVAGRWTLKMYPIKGQIDALAFDNGEGGVEEDAGSGFYVAPNGRGGFTYNGVEKKQAINTLFSMLDSLNKPTILVYPTPEVGWNISRMNYKKYLRGINIASSDASTSYTQFKLRNSFINDVFDQLETKNLIRVRPENLMCDTYIKSRCVAQLNGEPLYYDDDHLSNAGAQMVVQAIGEKLVETRNVYGTANSAPLSTSR